jgi:Clp protease
MCWASSRLRAPRADVNGSHSPRTRAPAAATVVSVSGTEGQPGGGGTSLWLHERLYERRIILVIGRLDDTVAARAAVALLTLDAAGDAPIEVHVDSPDGTLEAAFVVIDTLGMIRAPVRALCRARVGTRRSASWPRPGTARPRRTRGFGSLSPPCGSSERQTRSTRGGASIATCSGGSRRISRARSGGRSTRSRMT